MTDEHVLWLVAGLGNPGRRYVGTRHNVGFMVVEEIAERYRVELREKKEVYRIGRGSIEHNNVILMEPLVFMNLSGAAVVPVCHKNGIQLERLIVIHDDLDMETGRLRIRKTGSSGGHKGVESVIQSLGSRDFIRVKIGIGREARVPAEQYVLTRFGKSEMQVMHEAIVEAADAVRMILVEGVGAAMNRYNVRQSTDA